MLTVLFVEDDTAVRDVVLRILSEKNFVVLTASNAHEALQVVKARHVDLLFTDIVMPGMDGVQLAKKAKLIRPGLKVLFATGYAQKVTERDAMRHGSILYKPLRASELLQAVQLLLTT